MRVALLNSRKPRGLEPDARWLRQTFRLAAEGARRGDVLCTSTGTLPYEVALYGAARAGGRLEVLVQAPSQAAEAAALLPEPSPGGGRAHLELIHLKVKGEELETAALARDREVIGRVDRAIAVAVRAGGQLEALLRARWLEGRPVSVVAPLGGDPQTRGNQRLIDAGVPLLEPEWWGGAGGDRACPEGGGALAEPLMEGAGRPACEEGGLAAERFCRWHEQPLSGPTLSHFTRACDGPWPGQSRREYLEDLWQGGARARRDAAACLERMLRTGRVLGSGRLIRGGYPVVSLTAVAPGELEAIHRYRRHLLRWDFVPCGLVFEQGQLERLGARPVRYLPPSEFSRLPVEERPFFQKHVPPACDYQAEREWRLVGDLELDRLPADSVRIFTTP